MRSAISLASILFATTPAYAAYNLVKEYSGANFFDGWTFYGNADNLTNGDVFYVDKANATSAKLAYVNDAGHAIMKIDDTSFVPYNEKRNSVRIETDDYFPVGTVLIFDATHLPFGCSVWPAFWTTGTDWPLHGEIDIVEGVNLMSSNQMAIHASTGCTQNGADCSQGAGCTVLEKAENSFGTGFASAGGGVWATQYDTNGINIWFWTRKSVPASVTSATNSIDVADWGTPSASYSASSCDVNKFFAAQKLILDITVCGDWAGADNIYQQSGCPSDGGPSPGVCYRSNVINTNGSNYADAYFEIAYVKAFSQQQALVATISDGSTVLTTPTGTTSGTGGAASPTGTGSNGSSGNTNGNGAAAVANTYFGVVAATLLSAITWILI